MTDTPLPVALQSALERHRAGDLAGAADAYEGILAVDPDNVDALHLLATVRLQQGDALNALRLADATIARAPGAADAHANRGSALQAMERYGEAAFAFRKAIDLQPGAAHLHYNLGNALRADGDKPGAVKAYRSALDHAPDLAQAHSNLGSTLSELGLFDEAVAHCERAVAVQPGYADAHYNLGNAHREAGRHDAARDAYLAALDLNPAHADALCNLGLTMMAEKKAEDAIAIFERALAADPKHDMARFYMAVQLWERDEDPTPHLAEMDLDDPAVRAWVGSLAYLSGQSPLIDFIHDPYRLLSYAMQVAIMRGMVLEFGVRHGASIRHLARISGQDVYGFDSFHGLPAAWGGEPKGVYSTEGALPDVPENVHLVEGLFEDTLPPFLAEHAEPVRFCNVDSDLYQSAATVLDALAPRIVPGTVLVFDEYLINPTWRDDEYRAFQEAVERYGWRYRYLAVSLVTKQAAVLIEAVGEKD